MIDVGWSNYLRRLLIFFRLSKSKRGACTAQERIGCLWSFNIASAKVRSLNFLIYLIIFHVLHCTARSSMYQWILNHYGVLTPNRMSFQIPHCRFIKVKEVRNPSWQVDSLRFVSLFSVFFQSSVVRCPIHFRNSWLSCHVHTVLPRLSCRLDTSPPPFFSNKQKIAISWI